jgi:hypothetical protein
MKLVALVLIATLVAGCSKKSDPAKSDPAAAAPAKAEPSTPPAAAPPAVAQCPGCVKYDACCKALLAVPDSPVNASDCDNRAEMCNGTSPETGAAMDKTCTERVADWNKAKPDVAACH